MGHLNDNDSGMLKETLAFHAERENQCRLDLVIAEQEIVLFKSIKPKLYKDGNEWCCLYGENIMEGIVGFGETPYQAILDWDCAFHRKIPEIQTSKKDLINGGNEG